MPGCGMCARLASHSSRAAAPVRDTVKPSALAMCCNSCITAGLTQRVSFTVWRLAGERIERYCIKGKPRIRVKIYHQHCVKLRTKRETCNRWLHITACLYARAYRQAVKIGRAHV